MNEKSAMKHLTDANFNDEIKNGVTLVDFYANWCGPCRMLAPVLDQVAKDLHGEAAIGKVDIDVEQETAGRFQITSVPTMILFKNGKELQRIVGLRDAKAIKDLLASATKA